MSAVPVSPWAPLVPEQLPRMFGGTGARWWLSGGVALDRWLGVPIRARENIDISTTAADLPSVVTALTARFSVWATVDGEVRPWAEASAEEDLQPVLVHDDAMEAWVLQVNVEDGAPRAWMYKREV